MSSPPIISVVPPSPPTPYANSYEGHAQQQPQTLLPQTLPSQRSLYQGPSSPYEHFPTSYIHYIGSPYTGSSLLDREDDYRQQSNHSTPPRSRRSSWQDTSTPPILSALGVPLPSSAHYPRHLSRNIHISSPRDYYRTSGENKPGALSLKIHPLLDGEAFPNNFVFNLAHQRCTPMIVYGPGEIQVLQHESFGDLGTSPPLTRMRITHERIPWPIDLGFRAGYTFTSPVSDGTPHSAQGAPPPIMVYDVLFAVHQSLHTPITYLNLAQLSTAEEADIAKAYTKRCNLVPSEADFQLSQGIKRVDYLLDKTYFRGLLKEPDVDESYHFRLLT